MRHAWLVIASLVILASLGCATSSSSAPSAGVIGTTAAPPAHPFMLFNKAELPGLAQRKSDPLLAKYYAEMRKAADADDAGLVDRAVARLGGARAARGEGGSDIWSRLEARALVAQLDRDPALAGRAIELMIAAVQKVDPAAYYNPKADFHGQAEPLRALGLAWDWLYEYMTPAQRAQILPGLEKWATACYDSTMKQWWRDGSYNVGAVPTAGMGILALAIRNETHDAKVKTVYREAVRRIGQNFFPMSWRPSGICFEGPNYAIVGYRYVSVLCEALRRAGGADLLSESGARLAMQYEMHQWMPVGGCAPIGDNTSYGWRTFAPEYLLGVGQTKDATGLWTFLNWGRPERVDPMIGYLWYPVGLRPASPAQAHAPNSRYFEMVEDRAGYFFARTAWEDPDAAFFAFTTRYDKCNHQHYDHNAFLLTALGTQFATHRLLFPYGNVHLGVDYEHNTVIIDEGGWPRSPKLSNADKNSTFGYMMGVVACDFADYVRGDAKWSYLDNTFLNDDPAVRAERACLFVKSGPTPYLLIVDDQQFRENDRDYHWLWHAPISVPLSGSGTIADPLVMVGKNGNCALQFVTPEKPEITTRPAEELTGRGTPATQPSLTRIDAKQRGVRVQYAAVATLEKTDQKRPVLKPAQVTGDSTTARGLTIQWPDGGADHLMWQSEEDRIQAGADLTSGSLKSDGLLAMVRTSADGKVTGFVLGEGTYLKWGDRVLVQAKDSVCVSSGPEGTKVEGRRRAREGLDTVPPKIVHLEAAK